MGLVISNVQREALRIWAGSPYDFQLEITEKEAKQFFHYEQSRVKRVTSFYHTNVGGTDADIHDSAQSL
jgi:hypothetical protein